MLDGLLKLLGGGGKFPTTNKPAPPNNPVGIKDTPLPVRPGIPYLANGFHVAPGLDTQAAPAPTPVPHLPTPFTSNQAQLYQMPDFYDHANQHFIQFPNPGNRPGQPNLPGRNIPLSQIIQQQGQAMGDTELNPRALDPNQTDYPFKHLLNIHNPTFANPPQAPRITF